MNIERTQDFLFWSIVFNVILLWYWFGWLYFKKEAITKVQKRLLRINLDETQIEFLHVFGIMLYKLMIIFFLIVPYFVILLMF